MVGKESRVLMTVDVRKIKPRGQKFPKVLILDFIEKERR